jgi:hypothetical protein
VLEQDDVIMLVGLMALGLISWLRLGFKNICMRGLFDGLSFVVCENFKQHRDLQQGLAVGLTSRCFICNHCKCVTGAHPVLLSH